MDRTPVTSTASSSPVIWGCFRKQKGRTLLPGLFQTRFALFGGVGGACCQECRQFANIWLLGTRRISITGSGTPTARATLARLAGLTGFACTGINLWRCFARGRSRLIASCIAFGTGHGCRTLAVWPLPIRTLPAALIARRALFTLLLGALIAFTLLVTILLLRRLLRLG